MNSFRDGEVSDDWTGRIVTEDDLRFRSQDMPIDPSMPYRCQHCGQVFAKQSELDRHLRTDHPVDTDPKRDSQKNH